MSREAGLVFLAVAMAWTVAITVKAAKAIVGGYCYRFSRWDGGLIREGKTLTRTGTHIKLVVTSIVVFGVIGLFTGLLPMREGAWAIVAVLAISVISDSVTMAR
jgi:hypothetical protein